MDTDVGKTVLVSAKTGKLRYAEEKSGEYWIPLLSERADADAGGERELLLMLIPMAEAFHFQLTAHKGEECVLNPYTNPLWIPNGIIPVLLDAGRHRM